MEDGTVRKVPIAKVNVECGYISGNVEAMVIQTPAFDLIIGNTSEVVRKFADSREGEIPDGKPHTEESVVPGKYNKKGKWVICNFDQKTC